MNQNLRGKLSASVDRFGRRFVHNKLYIFFIVASFVVTSLLLLAGGQMGSLFSQFRLSDYEVGEPAPRELIAERSVTYVDEEATQIRKDAVAKLVSPIFVVNDDISERIVQRLDRFAEIVTDPSASTYSVEKLFLELQAALPGVFERDLVAKIAESGNILPVVNEVRIILEQATAVGIVSESDLDRIGSVDTVAVRRDEGREPTVVEAAIDSVVRLSRIEPYVLSQTESRSIPREQSALIAQLVRALAEENAFYNEMLTRTAVETAREEVRPVVRHLVENERIVGEGEIVTESMMDKIEALSEFSATMNLNRIAGTVLFVLLLYAAAIVLLSPPFAEEPMRRKNGYLVIGCAVLYVAVSVVAQRVVGLPEHVPVAVILPTALIAMLVAILSNPRAAVSLSLVLAGSLLIVTNMDPIAAIFAFGSGMAASLVVIGAEKRIDLIRASVYLSLANVGIGVTLGLFQNYDLSRMLSLTGWAVLNGFMSGILNLGIMPFLEHLLNTATPFRLIELSDLNSPILKKMLTVAPGTYGHSVAVANLAESACREIGANPLLARVGAYYHDIGKIDQPEYFVENQREGNKHDELKPSLSVAVIKSHVKIGVERAKELGLPQEVVSIIAQHHGSGVISYFYRQALKSPDGTQIAPKDYSYSGTPPVSREAAVVMLADGVEAASRTLKKPTVSKLEKFVWKTILDRFTSQQMNNCRLTFRDLDMIKTSFVHILAGSSHSRIEYPEQEDEKQTGS